MSCLSLSLLEFYVTCNDISVIHVTAHDVKADLRLVAGLLSSRNLEYASLTGSCRCVHK